MTISAATRRVQYSGSAGVGPYSFSFEVLAQTDLAVYQNTTLLTLTTDYTVSLNGSGSGTVTLVVAATGSDTITIQSARPIARSSDYQTGGDLLADTLNDELDAQVIFLQQLEENYDRLLNVDPSDTATSLTLPAASDRASKYLAFDATGNPVATAGTTSVIVVSTFAETLLDDTTAAAMRATLDLEPGVDVQAYDADLAALAGLTSAANKVPMFSGSGTATLLDFKDEDNMASDSATAVPSQQSVKAYVDAVAAETLTLGTPAATTSGSSVSITGIPAGTKRIMLMLNGVSTTGTAVPRIQLGDAGGLETSGYTAIGVGVAAASIATADYTDGFGLRNDWNATRAANGAVVFCHMGSNVWVAQGSVQLESQIGGIVTGIKTLSGELDRIGIVTSDAFDAGSINVLYE